MIVSLILKGRHRLLSLSGQEPSILILPVSMQMLKWMYQNSFLFQTALEDFSGTISIHPPSHNLLQLQFNVQELPKCSSVPLHTLTVFTDGSGRTGQYVIVWKNDQNEWQSDIEIVKGSPQIVELSAVVRVFQK